MHMVHISATKTTFLEPKWKWVPEKGECLGKEEEEEDWRSLVTAKKPHFAG